MMVQLRQESLHLLLLQVFDMSVVLIAHVDCFVYVVVGLFCICLSLL